MPKRYNHLFEAIASFPALHAAAHKAVVGKRKKSGAAAFLRGWSRNCFALSASSPAAPINRESMLTLWCVTRSDDW